MNQFDKLVKSVKKGDIGKVSEILQQATLNINELDPKSGKGLLQIAMETENTDIFNMLVAYPGIDVQKPSKTTQLPLETAIILNNIYYVEKLLQTGNINPKKKNINQETALEVAIKHQTSSDIIKKLLQFKFDLNQPVNSYGSLINLAICNNQVENMMFLLNYGTEKSDKKDQLRINVLDQNDNTCLILAVQMNLGDAVLSILQYLNQPNCSLTELQKQFFVNAQNKQGNTALHLACIKNLQTIISIIESKGKPLGLDLTLRNKKGQTPEDIKAQTQKQRQMQKQLKSKNQQEKRIYLQEKEEEKQRRRQDQQRARIEEKRKKKEEELLLMKQQHYEKELKSSKAKWVCGILAILIIGIMYLVLLNTVESKKNAQF